MIGNFFLDGKTSQAFPCHLYFSLNFDQSLYFCTFTIPIPHILFLCLSAKILYTISGKVVKVMRVRLVFSTGSIIPALHYEERSSSKTEDERRTAEYDSFAIRTMTICLLPAIVGITVYSLVHNTYKSWYSWIISSLADSVYFFGFISMTPQLYINYKLKSVAHLPIKVVVISIRLMV